MHRGRRYKIQSMSSPPAFASASVGYRYNSCNLGAFAKPTNARYSTNALSITLITVVKQFYRVEIPPDKVQKHAEDKGKRCEFEPKLSHGCLAGNGVVTVKRTVHGYKKLSLVNRVELSRSEISLPPMEYDTNALWIDTEASVLAELMPDYDKGVHALSHAIVAVAPLFVPCNSSDLDCDHSHYGCTRILLFDVRAGGAGTCSLLWRYFFHPDGILKAAIDLLSECPLECDAGHYKGGEFLVSLLAD
jgi:DEAD/DEAH box helicase domain-containing protein